MNFGTLFKAVDAAMGLLDVARKFRGDQPPTAPAETGLATTPTAPGLTGQLEARLTNVVVAALKEAFDRDHARLELERAQMEEQHRRAQEAMRLELRRQAADREIGRFRLLAGTALAGWVASVVLLLARIGSVSPVSRGVLAASWLLLLGALGAAFSAQGRLGAYVPEGEGALDPGPGGAAALWLLIAGLALAAISLLF